MIKNIFLIYFSEKVEVKLQSNFSYNSTKFHWNITSKMGSYRVRFYLLAFLAIQVSAGELKNILLSELCERSKK